MVYAHRNTSISRRSRKIVTTIGVLLSVGILGPLPCRSAPSFVRKPAWRNINEADVISRIVAKCDPVKGRCWGFLPVLETQDSYNELAELQREHDNQRVRILRTRNVDQTPPDSWQLNQMGNGRLPKDKDLSKLTAGGMPFSVLYTGPQGRMTLPSGSAGGMKGELAKLTDQSSASSLVTSGNGRTLQSTSRLTPRNGGSSSLRRNHPGIPQLFISYGWGPAGK